VQDEIVMGIRVYLELSTSMICMIYVTSKNIRFTPSQVL
jgi:hypothetical protein